MSLGVGVDVGECTRVGLRVDVGAVLRNTFAHAHTHTHTPSVFTLVAALVLCFAQCWNFDIFHGRRRSGLKSSLLPGFPRASLSQLWISLQSGTNKLQPKCK